MERLCRKVSTDPIQWINRMIPEAELSHYKVKSVNHSYIIRFQTLLEALLFDQIYTDSPILQVTFTEARQMFHMSIWEVWSSICTAALSQAECLKYNIVHIAPSNGLFAIYSTTPIEQDNIDTPTFRLHKVPVPTTTSRRPAKQPVYVIWDAENCCLGQANPAVMKRNLEYFIRMNHPTAWKIHMKGIINYVLGNEHHPTISQMMALSDIGCSMMVHPKQGSTDMAIMNMLDEIILEYNERPVKPIIYLITGDRDFIAKLQHMQRSDITQIGLIYKDQSCQWIREIDLPKINWSIILDENAHIPSVQMPYELIQYMNKPFNLSRDIVPLPVWQYLFNEFAYTPDIFMQHAAQYGYYSRDEDIFKPWINTAVWPVRNKCVRKMLQYIQLRPNNKIFWVEGGYYLRGFNEVELAADTATVQEYILKIETRTIDMPNWNQYVMRAFLYSYLYNKLCDQFKCHISMYINTDDDKINAVVTADHAIIDSVIYHLTRQFTPRIVILQLTDEQSTQLFESTSKTRLNYAVWPVSDGHITRLFGFDGIVDHLTVEQLLAPCEIDELVPTQMQIRYLEWNMNDIRFFLLNRRRSNAIFEAMTEMTEKYRAKLPGFKLVTPYQTKPEVDGFVNKNVFGKLYCTQSIYEEFMTEFTTWERIVFITNMRKTRVRVSKQRIMSFGRDHIQNIQRQYGIYLGIDTVRQSIEISYLLEDKPHIDQFIETIQT